MAFVPSNCPDSKRRTFTIPATTEAQTDFPVLLVFNATNGNSEILSDLGSNYLKLSVEQSGSQRPVEIAPGEWDTGSEPDYKYTASANGSGYTSHTLRSVHDLSVAGVTASLSRIRVWVPPKVGGISWTANKMYIGVEHATNNFDFADTPVEVLQGGTSGVTSGTGGAWSDWVDIDFESTDNLVISAYTTTGTPPYVSGPGGPGLRFGQIVGDYAATVDVTPTVNSVHFGCFGFGWETPAKAVIYTNCDTSTTAATELVVSWDETQDDNSTYVGVTGSAIAQTVWDSNSYGRWAMAQDPSGSAPQLLDSTGSNDGTSIGTMTSGDLVDGTIGAGQDFDGTDDGFALSANLGLTSYPFAIFAHFEVDNLSTVQPIISGDIASNYAGATLQIGTSGQVELRLGDGSGTTSSDYKTFYTANSIIAATTEYTISVLVADFSTVTLCVDGAAVTMTSTTGTGASADLTNASYRIGTSVADSTFFDGKIYELIVRGATLSANQAYLFDLGWTDALGTWAAYSSAGDLAAWLEQPYNLSDPLATYITQLYGLTVNLTATIEQPYSGLIQTHLLQYYGDVPRLRAALLQYYGDAPALEAALLQYYGDALPLAAHLEQPYALVPLLAAALEQRYGIAAGQRAAELLQHYHLDATARLSAALIQRYLLEGEPGTDLSSYTLTIDGEGA